ncbi:MAG TPA: ribonuclease P [Halobacteria archaeon]|nr:ribonuclease P [Halobacteria archaeon]
MKILPSSLRTKRWYIAFELICDEKIDEKDLINSIWSAGLLLVGAYKMSLCNIHVINYNGKKGIISCAREEMDTLRAVLAIINKIDNEKVAINVLGVGGSIKKVNKKYIKD